MAIKEDIKQRLYNEKYASEVDFYDGSQNFDVGVHQYPSDLGSEDLLHYVEFGINVRGKSEVNTDNRLFEVTRSPDSAGMTRDQVANASTTLTGFAVGATAYTLTNSITKNALGWYDSKVAKSGGKVPGTSVINKILGAGAGALAAKQAYDFTTNVIDANKFLKPDTSYRISDVIALHVDGPPTVRYGMNYANKDLGTLAGILKGSVSDTLKGLSTTGEPAAALVSTFAKLPGVFGIDLQSMISASSKTSLNPFRETVFESVDFRSFAFKYKFLPKNKQESEAVRQIIKLFKYHMHPEVSNQKLFFIYPSEFQITYYYGSDKNMYFHQFAPCLLESMEVSYGGEQFASFDDGNPVEVNMALTFRETEILTKQMIKRGY